MDRADEHMKAWLSSLFELQGKDKRRQIFDGAARAAIIGGVFALFNAALGAIFHSNWNSTIAVYYLSLALSRALIYLTDRQPKHVKGHCMLVHVWLLLTGIGLVVPITLMVLGERTYHYGMIPAIAMAVYTVTRIFRALFYRYRPETRTDLPIRTLATVNLQDALLSVLTLQNALIIAGGESMHRMMPLTILTSGIIWLAIILAPWTSLLSILSYRPDKESVG